MFATLPLSVQQQVLSYLEADNFIAAKQLYDQCLLQEIAMQNSLDNEENIDQ